MIPTLANNYTQASTVVTSVLNYGSWGPSSRMSLPFSGLLCAGVVRHPGDPVYVADIILQNVVVGSRYRIERASDGYLITEGVASAAVIELDNQPAYSEDMLFTLKVRNASGSPVYTSIDQYGVLSRRGIVIYVDQKID